jgi:hypothetical protein
LPQGLIPGAGGPNLWLQGSVLGRIAPDLTRSGLVEGPEPDGASQDAEGDERDEQAGAATGEETRAMCLEHLSLAG